jgi:HD-like signal output (HDOD) protein
MSCSVRQPDSSDARTALREVLGARRLPVFPAQHARILECIREDHDNPAPLVEAISLDPAVSVRVLRLANSAALGLRCRVDSIQRAVVVLGRAQLESLVVGLGVFKAIPRHRVGPLDRRKFWENATQRAGIARCLAQQVMPSAAAVGFTAGLISDLAVPLMTGARPRLYKDLLKSVRREGAALELLERESLGWDHADVAGWLATTWELPTRLVTLLATHHHPMPDERNEAGIVRAAAIAMGSTGLEPDPRGRFSQASTACWHHLGIAPDDSRRALRNRGGNQDPLAKVFS